MTEVEARLFIQKFESGGLVELEWHHREHLLMALWYLLYFDEFQAVVKIKAGILRYNLIYDVPQSYERGYHETITMFFIKFVQSFQSKYAELATWDDKAQFLLSNCTDFRAKLKEHYRVATLRSREARISWIAPDLKDLTS